MVPGIPGYVSMRERQNMKWTKADGTQNPDWWEIDSKRDTDVSEKVEYAGQAQEGEDEFVIVSHHAFRTLSRNRSSVAETPRDHSQITCGHTSRRANASVRPSVLPESPSVQTSSIRPATRTFQYRQ